MTHSMTPTLGELRDIITAHIEKHPDAANQLLHAADYTDQGPQKTTRVVVALCTLHDDQRLSIYTVEG